VTNEAKPHVYDVLAKAFIQEGVSTCFTLMGDANMNWAARLAQQGCRMVYVSYRH
jgi:acetolactate synthase-1/2/3 large subunit